ncbi:MAG TPA: hypothetical protein VNJ01_11930 [Bacteriovoracaceae bacterium]|nr:hypothetical protein [Bacteriovoracaceae bacterium]
MILLAPLIASTMAYAESFNLRCKAVYNSEVILERDVTLELKQRNLKIGGTEPFEFILSSNGDKKIELQAYNNWEPARSYATATLTAADSFVELSIWKREYLMEARCTLLP